MNKYKRLLSNTVLFAISSFSSKVLIFLLMPFYTQILDPSQKAVADQILKSGNLMIPIVSIGIASAVIRFGLDRAYKKDDVFTSGLTALGIGFGVSILFFPLLNMVPSLKGYVPLLYLFVFVSVLRNICSQFVRAKMFTRLYAIDGIFNTICYVACMILFLKTFGWGIEGFVLATIVADLLSGVFLFVVAGLHKYIGFTTGFKKTFKSMLVYSLPLIPSTMFWWITNTSDQYFVYYMRSPHEAGLYSTAYAIPHIIMMFSTLFTEAWQLSAVTDGGKDAPGRERFFSKVFLSFQGVLFVVSAGLILFSKVFMGLLAADAYYEGWRYIPMLVIAMTYSCFVTFIGSIYIVEKKSGLSFYTMLIGAALNLVLNAIFIPIVGASGAALATFLSYLLVFVVRAFNTKKYIKMKLYPAKIVVNTILLFIQTWVMLAEPAGWVIYSGLLCAAVIALNISSLWLMVKKILIK